MILTIPESESESEVVSDSLLPNGHQALPSMGFSRQEYWSGLQYLNIHIIKVPMD